MRVEKDFIGSKDLDENALYGIHSLRAKENFPDNSPFPIEWYQAVGFVKLAMYQTIDKFYQAIEKKYGNEKILQKKIENKLLLILIETASEVAGGQHFEYFIVPGISGGAGTSINMNVNEIITNVALLKLGKKPGDYNLIDPIEDANLYQSTNDVIPTALKVVIMKLLGNLEGSINSLRKKIEEIEKGTRDYLRTAYTQMQEAVPSSYGRLFSTYNEALSRDWWRVSKCFERIKVINLGGGAAGTTLTVPRYIVIEAVKTLQKITGLPLTRSENLNDATSNLDSFVEVHAILKAHAVNLQKMVSDLRLLSSDISGKEIEIPQKQIGSSVMPGKINPVIPEFVISASHKIYSNDILISSLCALGCLDLNAYIPVIGCTLIETIKLLIACNNTLLDNLFQNIIVHQDKSFDKLYHSPAITTALLPLIGYHAATQLAIEMKTSGLDIFMANQKLQLIGNEKLKKILEPSNLLKEGFTINDLINFKKPDDSLI